MGLFEVDVIMLRDPNEAVQDVSQFITDVFRGRSIGRVLVPVGQIVAFRRVG